MGRAERRAEAAAPREGGGADDVLGPYACLAESGWGGTWAWAWGGLALAAEGGAMEEERKSPFLRGARLEGMRESRSSAARREEVTASGMELRPRGVCGPASWEIEAVKKIFCLFGRLGFCRGFFEEMESGWWWL